VETNVEDGDITHLCPLPLPGAGMPE
jgi:hypothetical protein